MILALTLLLSACTSTQDKWQEQYDLGVRYLTEGNYEEAIIAFTTAIEIDPEQTPAYQTLAQHYIEQCDYDAAAEILRKGVENTNDPELQELLNTAEQFANLDMEHLVTDAYANEPSYTLTAYDGTSTTYTAKYHIPKINLPGETVAQVNNDIYIYISSYQEVESALDCIAQGGYPMTREGISYQWTVKEDILSLLLVWEGSPDMGFSTEYHVYNVRIPSGESVSEEDVAIVVGFSKEEYALKAKQALGSAFWEGESYDLYAQNMADFFNDCLKNTISDENIAEVQPFFNADGNLCIVGKVYSLVGADYYSQILNLEDFELYENYDQLLEVDQTPSPQSASENTSQTEVGNTSQFKDYNNDDLEQIAQLIAQHYNDLWQPEGTYTCFGSEAMLQNDTYLFFLRYSRSDREVEEIMQAGGFPSANVLQGGVYVQSTGEVTDDFNSDAWYIDLP